MIRWEKNSDFRINLVQIWTERKSRKLIKKKDLKNFFFLDFRFWKTCMASRHRIELPIYLFNTASLCYMNFVSIVCLRPLTAVAVVFCSLTFFYFLLFLGFKRFHAPSGRSDIHGCPWKAKKWRVSEKRRVAMSF